MSFDQLFPKSFDFSGFAKYPKFVTDDWAGPDSAEVSSPSSSSDADSGIHSYEPSPTNGSSFATVTNNKSHVIWYGSGPSTVSPPPGFNSYGAQNTTKYYPNLKIVGGMIKPIGAERAERRNNKVCQENTSVVAPPPGFESHGAEQRRCEQYPVPVQPVMHTYAQPVLYPAPVQFVPGAVYPICPPVYYVQPQYYVQPYNNYVPTYYCY